MYNTYLEIYEFATSLFKARVLVSSPGQTETEDEVRIPLADRFSKIDLWAYRLVYSAIWLSNVIYAFLIAPSDTTNTQPMILNVFLGSLGAMVVGVMHGSVMYRLVRRWHIANPAQVYRYRKLDYEDLYPAKLRRKLWLWNAFPFLYLTFVVTPILTRIHYFVETKLEPALAARTYRKGEGPDQKAERYTAVRNFVEKRPGVPSPRMMSQLNLLRTLFERRISEIASDVQRIAIVLSSLGIVISVVGYMAREPVRDLLEGGLVALRIIVAVIVLSIIGLIAAILVHFLTQLQIQNTKSRDLTVVLDVVDVMLAEAQQLGGTK